MAWTGVFRKLTESVLQDSSVLAPKETPNSVLFSEVSSCTCHFLVVGWGVAASARVFSRPLGQLSSLRMRKKDVFTRTHVKLRRHTVIYWPTLQKGQVFPADLS